MSRTWMQKSFNKDIPEAVNIGTNIALSTKDPWLDDYDMKELHEDHSSTKKDVIRTKKKAVTGALYYKLRLFEFNLLTTAELDNIVIRRTCEAQKEKPLFETPHIVWVQYELSIFGISVRAPWKQLEHSLKSERVIIAMLNQSGQSSWADPVRATQAVGYHVRYVYEQPSKTRHEKLESLAKFDTVDVDNANGELVTTIYKLRLVISLPCTKNEHKWNSIKSAHAACVMKPWQTCHSLIIENIYDPDVSLLCYLLIIRCKSRWRLPPHDWG